MTFPKIVEPRSRHQGAIHTHHIAEESQYDKQRLLEVCQEAQIHALKSGARRGAERDVQSIREMDEVVSVRGIEDG